MFKTISRRGFLSNSGLLLGGAVLAGSTSANDAGSGGATGASKEPHDYIIAEGHRDIWELTARLMLRVESQNSPVADFLVPRLIAGGVSVCIMPAGGDSLPERSYLQPTLEGDLRTLDMLLVGIERTNGKASIIKKKSDIPTAPNRDKVQFIFDLEGGEGLGTLCGPEPEFLADYQLALLRQLFRLGVRGVQLTHNGRNQIGDGVAGSRTGGRLSPFGVELVKEMNRLGMMVGVSHLSLNGVLHVAEITKYPIVSTHQNLAQYVSSHPPVELVPEEVKAIVSTGGVVGMRYMGPQMPYAKMVDEIEFLAKNIGVEHIGVAWLGHDVGNPAPHYVPGFTQPERVFTGPEAESIHTHYSTFIGLLAERGFTEQQIGMIMGGNYLRIWKQVLPD